MGIKSLDFIQAGCSISIDRRTGPQPSEAPGVGPFYYKKEGFIIQNKQKGTFYEKGPTFDEKKSPCQECPGAEHIGWIHPNHSPTIPKHFLYSLIDFMYKSIYIYIYSIEFS